MEDNDIIDKILDLITEAENSEDYSSINQNLLEKRLGWYERNKDKLNLEGSDVKKAYTLLLIKYMEIDPEEVPVVYEDDKKITWRSYNWCPVLEACKKGEFDTREVCKKGWEKSVHAIIEKINPNLVFSRNYETLRPHGEYCEETIELVE